ncbi:hypothetical protein [Paenibacillus polymyxa]|uniref:hypothetical protein n=1 Tax=Paenibacillus polymyxa TaxID=1406 RepID=UPI0025B67C8C|nr:hypothetical protein [Paenibacillus polymyxa]MDN4085939.1 hypothetical protein [Paenibacillus polymyxa]MDN4111841.1 hypothetical protein [Paenibacillus polymyxa]
MDKAILNQAQAEAIDSIQAAQHWTAEAFVRSHVANSHRWDAPCDVLNGVPLDTIIRALYIGYEVRKTMEERMKEAFDEITAHDGCFCGESVAEANGFHAGFITALKIAGIEVPGITD